MSSFFKRCLFSLLNCVRIKNEDGLQFLWSHSSVHLQWCLKTLLTSQFTSRNDVLMGLRLSFDLDLESKFLESWIQMLTSTFKTIWKIQMIIRLIKKVTLLFIKQLDMKRSGSLKIMQLRTLTCFSSWIKKETLL